MKKRSAFQIVDVADEHLAVAVGPDASSFNGVVVLSEPASFLLKNMDQPKTRDELIALLTDMYDVASETAAADVDRFLRELVDLGLAED